MINWRCHCGQKFEKKREAPKNASNSYFFLSESGWMTFLFFLAFVGVFDDLFVVAVVVLADGVDFVDRQNAAVLVRHVLEVRKSCHFIFEANFGRRHEKSPN